MREGAEGAFEYVEATNDKIFFVFFLSRSSNCMQMQMQTARRGHFAVIVVPVQSSYF